MKYKIVEKGTSHILDEAETKEEAKIKAYEWEHRSDKTGFDENDNIECDIIPI